MTFSLHQGGVVILSQITPTQSLTHTPLSIYLIFSSWALFTVYPNRIM